MDYAGVGTSRELKGHWFVGQLGSSKLLQPKSVGNLHSYVAAGFLSKRAYASGKGTRLTKRKGGTAALWKSLVGKKLFPHSALIETETVQDYLRKLEAERR